MSNPIHIFTRHNNGSIHRKKEVRPSWFSFQKCFDSLLVDTADITVCLDGNLDSHHVDFRGKEVIEFTGGSDAASFAFLLKTVQEKSLPDNTIVYIVEDDYLHRPNWDTIMVEAFETFDVDHVTLYDHPDKYFLPMYNGLQSKILHSKSVHWRTTPSTCSTYAARMGTLKKYWEIHEKYSRPEITHDGYDHTKFIELWNVGSNLVSPIPGYSTHCEMPFVSPLFPWETL